MSEVQTIITAAGETSRDFANAGYGTPKNLIDLGGVPLLVHSVRSYSMNPFKSVVAIGEVEQAESDTFAVVREMVPGVRVALIAQGAKGALVTAILAAGEVELDLPLVIAGGDSEIQHGIADLITVLQERKSPAGTIVFRASEPRWSYLDLDASGRTRQVVEKRVVGEYATTGVFYFESARTFLSAARWCLVNNAQTNGRFFVSAALNYLLHEGRHVDWVEIPRGRYRSYAGPEDLRRWRGTTNE